MPLTQGDAGTLFSPLREALDRLFVESGRIIDEGVAHSPTLDLLTAGQPLPMDIYETETEFILDAAVPGLPLEAIAISASSQLITLRAQWPSGARAAEQPGRYVRHERYEGEMERRIRLTAPIDPQRISTTYVNGLLTVRMPKMAQTQAIPVEVQTEYPSAPGEPQEQLERTAPLW